jgi:hypothetical protein
VQLAARPNETVCWCLELSQKNITVLFWWASNWKLGIVIFVKPTWIFWRYDYSTKALSAIMRLKESEPYLL